MIFREIRTFDFRKTIMRKSTIRKTDSGFSETIMLKHSTSSSNPAAGRGKVPLTTRKDGRHPKFKDHGRIAGC
jgi:hypothetical protein